VRIMRMRDGAKVASLGLMPEQDKTIDNKEEE
jgi:hypothetical protein